MKKEKITIKPDYTKIRNDLHFQIQLKTRMQIQENKKKYNRKKLKKIIIE
jgi:hypothetical protein